jgi:hypothetical protein
MFNKITASLGVNGGHEVNSGMTKIKNKPPAQVKVRRNDWPLQDSLQGLPIITAAVPPGASGTLLA